jgi:hypothetical protein
MTMLEAWKPLSILVVLWPTQEVEYPEDYQEFGQKICSRFSRFNRQQIVKPPPGTSLHPETARLILMAENPRLIAELAPSKVSLRILNEGSKTALPDLHESIRETLLQLHAWLAEIINLRVYRIGMVTQLFSNTKSSAAEKLASYFFQPRALQGQAPTEIHLNIHSRLTLDGGIMANRWIRAKPLRTNDRRQLDFGAQFEIDLNTMIEDSQVKTPGDIDQFVRAGLKHNMEEVPLFHDGEFFI